jgi:hypothetical protein
MALFSWKIVSNFVTNLSSRPERSGVERSAVSLSCAQLEPSAARHAHDQFGVGIIDGGAQRSWSGIGQVEACRGGIIMVNRQFLLDFRPFTV